MNQRLTQSSECTKIILKIYQFWHFNMSFEKTFNLWNIILLHRTFSSHGEDRDRVPDNKALPVWHPSKVLWVFMQGRPDCHVWPHLTGHHRNIRNGNSVVILLSKHQTVIWRENKQVQTLPCQAQRPPVTTGGTRSIWSEMECPTFCENLTCGLTIIPGLEMSLVFTDLLSEGEDRQTGCNLQSDVILRLFTRQASVWTTTCGPLLFASQVPIMSNQYLRVGL